MNKLPLCLASALLMLGAAQVRADEVKLTTALATGENLVLALNADLGATLTWAGGETQQITSDGSLINLPVKGATLTITTTSGKLTSLYVQGDKLTAIDLSGATNLKELFAADNSLKSLTLKPAAGLERLDLQDNQLTALSAGDLKNLKELNVANNKITSANLKLNSEARLTHFVAAGNALSTAPTAAAFSEAKAVWVEDNSLSTLSLNQSGDLRTLLASGNKLKSLTLTAVPHLTEAWVSDNALTKLDLSKGSAKLTVLAADHNKLTSIEWDKAVSKTFMCAYLNDNALFINSMPTVRGGANPMTVVYEPQSPYEMDKDYYELNEQYDWSDLLRYNGWGVSAGTTYTLTDETGYQLVKGTDFKESGRRFTFLKGYAGVVVTYASKDYTLKTKPINIGKVSGITDAVTATGLTVSSDRGSLTVSSSKAVAVTVYAADGTVAASGRVDGAPRTWQLPTGLYIVGGHKVIVP